tara:strand:+ start:115 stop:252 length:138 start_codon:yes stop_codon:yes gene_type:complete
VVVEVEVVVMQELPLMVIQEEVAVVDNLEVLQDVEVQVAQEMILL